MIMKYRYNIHNVDLRHGKVGSLKKVDSIGAVIYYHQKKNKVNWHSVYAVCKPGAFVLVLTSSTEQHELAIKLEQAGFEIRDLILWASQEQTVLVTLARKLCTNVALNLKQYGVGGLNIDRCRVPIIEVPGGNLALNSHLRTSIKGGKGGNLFHSDKRWSMQMSHGRWPANFLHDGSHEVLQSFPQTKSGMMQAGLKRDSTKRSYYSGDFPEIATLSDTYGDAGSASRFFYQASNKIDLLRYLVRLTVPHHEVCLDPCLQSTLIGRACLKEGKHYLGLCPTTKRLERAQQRLTEFASTNQLR